MFIYQILQQILGNIRLLNDLYVVLCFTEEHLEFIWQPKAAQDLLWNLITTELLEMSLSLTSLLQGAPQLCISASP